MTDFDISLEEYMNLSSNFDVEIENYEVCESLLLPVEEGLMDKIKSGFKKIYEKFHKIFTDFKNWVKRIVKRIRSFFKKDKENADTEKAKEDVSRVEDVLKSAEGVDKELADALYAKGPKRDSEVSSFNYSEEYQSKADEMRELKKKADESVSEMKEVKETVSKVYLLPETTEAGDMERYKKIARERKIKENKEEADRGDMWEDNKKVSAVLRKYAETNPFGVSDNTGPAFTYTKNIIEACEIAKLKKTLSGEPIGKGMIGGVVGYLKMGFEGVAYFASREPTAARKAFQYMSKKVSSDFNTYKNYFAKKYKTTKEDIDYAKENPNEYEDRGDDIAYLYREAFLQNPTSSTLEDYIKAASK